MTKTLQKDIEELKAAMNMMSSEMATLTKQQSIITELLEEIKRLKLQNGEQQKRIVDLEDRVSDLEQYSRINDVIISGFEVRPQSYRQAVMGLESEGNGDHEETTEKQVTAFLRSKNISIDESSIEACHVLPSRTLMNKPSMPVMIIRFANSKHKVELLKQGRNLRGTNVYINEHLTKKNAEIARKARWLRKQGKIQSTWTASCKVFIMPLGAPENARGLCVKSIDQLDKFDKN